MCGSREQFYFMFVAYEDFFTRGANLVRDLKPHMSRHQQCADQSKTEYEDLRARSRGFVPPSTPKAAIDPTVLTHSPPLPSPAHHQPENLCTI